VQKPYVLQALFAMCAAASLLAGCGGGGAVAPVTPIQIAPAGSAGSEAQALSTARSTDNAGHHGSDRGPVLSADPRLLNFTAADAANRTPRTVTITAPGSVAVANVAVSIAGIGDCPVLGSTKLTFKQVGGKLEATLSVTPRGAGPALCTIRIARHDDDGRRDHDCDGDLAILVLVDCGPVATPPPSPTPAPTPTATPEPTPSPSPTPCTGRVC
jgi:hypothetical protein